MSKIVDIDERSFKEKVEWKIYNAKCRAKNVYHWVKEHPTQTMIIVSNRNQSSKEELLLMLAIMFLYLLIRVLLIVFHVIS